MENYSLASSKTMKDTISVLFEEADKLLSLHCSIHEKSMVICQSMGYNGFKRWHRYRSKEFYDLKIQLENILIDEFRIQPDIKEYEITYTPGNMEEHLTSWESAILEGIEKLGRIYNQYYDTVGRCCKPIEKANKILIKDYKKVGKLLKRFTDSDWLTLDMHIVDDKLHKKYKEKENECC